MIIYLDDKPLFTISGDSIELNNDNYNSHLDGLVGMARRIFESDVQCVLNAQGNHEEHAATDPCPLDYQDFFDQTIDMFKAHHLAIVVP